MSRFYRKRNKAAGLPPGTPIYIGSGEDLPARITIIDYGPDDFQQKEAACAEDCFFYKDTPTVTWINIDGLRDVSLIEKIGKAFHLHPLVQEDIVNTYQRPKLEDYRDYFFIVLKMLEYDEEKQHLGAEQVSLILGPNYVISFQEKIGDIFDPVRNRIKEAKGRIREKGADYLAYSLIDAVVDNYFTILEKLGDRIEGMEEELTSNPHEELLHRIYGSKRELIFLRKSVWPLREVVNLLQRGESPLVSESTGIYFRDAYDHTIQVIDTVETFRDMVSGVMDIYLSIISNRMNEVMKVLTIIATIFIPISFIAGIYGMNFSHMPELTWRWGYPAVWLLIIAIIVGMVVFFRRKKWI